MGASVVLVERGKMGGDCLNFGCVPSKSLLAAAQLADLGRRGTGFGVDYAAPRIDFAAVGDSVGGSSPGSHRTNSAERFQALGVTVLRAEGALYRPAPVARRRHRDPAAPLCRRHRLATLRAR